MAQRNETLEFSLAQQKLYPHFKLTRERFPRLLVTRKIEADQAEYFGAFLPETGVRFWLDLLNRLFRLRSCEIEVNGDFPVPCPQFYRQRCIAPCVASLCDEKRYAQRVQLVRLFLRRDKAALEKYFLQTMEALAESLNFEAAQEQRNVWLTIEKLLTHKDWNFWLDDAVDTFALEETDEILLVHLVTMRARKTLGKRTFVFAKSKQPAEALPQLLPQLYRFQAPKVIRVPHDFAARVMMADELSLRFQRKIKIEVLHESQPKVMTQRALARTSFERDFRQIKRANSELALAAEFKQDFQLATRPRRIEAYDVAHISGTDLVLGKAVWEDGKIVRAEAEFWFSNAASELAAWRELLALRFASVAPSCPDLLVIDGGKAHLKAALHGLKNLVDRPFPVIAAVKPPQEHGQIAQFLTESGVAIRFDSEKPSHQILQRIRDEAHSLSNTIHRQRREHSYFYELAQILPSLTERQRLDLLKQAGSIKQILALQQADFVKLVPAAIAHKIAHDLRQYRAGTPEKIEPLLVPLRLTAENGEADDLRPLTTYQI